MTTRTVTLNDGVAIPQLGFGVFQIPQNQTQRAVEAALEAGYRHIDTAAAYNNEAGVGAAVRASGLPRNELFLTTKLRNGDQGTDGAYSGALRSRDLLGVETIDLYLVHWPSPARDAYVDSWRSLARLREDGVVRSIGVSNFLEEHLSRLIDETGVVPAVNQLECHPTYQQSALQRRCAELGISVEAYSPLGQSAALALPAIRAAADAHGVSPAQVVLRWHLQAGRIVIPKTTSPVRMVENAAVHGFELTAAEAVAIDAEETGKRIGGDPRTFEISQIR
jgi:2,5-diketo-D-gluconate reductase A